MTLMQIVSSPRLSARAVRRRGLRRLGTRLSLTMHFTSASRIRSSKTKWYASTLPRDRRVSCRRTRGGRSRLGAAEAAGGQGRRRTLVLHYGQMWRMQLYFWDSGYRAFTANVGVPGAIANSIKDTISGETSAAVFVGSMASLCHFRHVDLAGRQ